MYIHGLIPWNSAELAEAVPIDSRGAVGWSVIVVFPGHLLFVRSAVAQLVER